MHNTMDETKLGAIEILRHLLNCTSLSFYFILTPRLYLLSGTFFKWDTRTGANSERVGQAIDYPRLKTNSGWWKIVPFHESKGINLFVNLSI